MKKLSFLLSLLILSSILVAQKLPITNQYLMNRYVLSPSYAGIEEGVDIFVGYRDQWIDFKGAPVTKYLNIHGNAGNNVGVGGMLINDQEGVFNRMFGSLSYAYHLTASGDHKVDFSLSGMFYQSSINLSQAFIQDLVNDDVLQGRQTQNETTFNAGASILYRFNGLNVSLGAPVLIQNKSKYYNVTNPGTDGYVLRRHFMGHISYDYNLSDEKYSLTPYLIIRATDYAPLNYEFALQFKYNKMAWVAASYRKEGSMTASAGFDLNEKIALNYTYEFMGKNVTGNTDGTHELGIGLYLGRGIKEMKEKQKEIEEKADSIATSTKDIKTEVDEIKKESEKQNNKVDNQIDILQERLNDVELEVGKLKTMTDNINQGIGDYSNLTEEEKKKLQDQISGREKELDAEILKIQKELKNVGGSFFVVVEAFKVPENAKKSITLWSDRGIKVNMIYNEVRDFYYVYAGKYTTYNQALEMKNKLKEEGVFGWIYLWAH